MSALHVSHNHFMHILVENCKQWPQFVTLPGFMPWQCELCSFFQKGSLNFGTRFVPCSEREQTWSTHRFARCLYDGTLNSHTTKTRPPTVKWDTWPSFPSCPSWHWANTQKLSLWLQTHKWSQLRAGWAHTRTAPLSQPRQLTCRITAYTAIRLSHHVWKGSFPGKK